MHLDPRLENKQKEKGVKLVSNQGTEPSTFAAGPLTARAAFGTTDSRTGYASY